MMARQSWTPKRATAKSLRKIESALNQLLGVAYEWGDVENYIVILVDEAIAALDILKEGIVNRQEDAS